MSKKRRQRKRRVIVGRVGQADRGGRSGQAGEWQRFALARFADEAERRERHARIVVSRVGDPNYVQRSERGGWTTYEWSAESAEGRRMLDAVRYQQEAFRAKFGRDPGPDDPLFFDPDADEPVQLTREQALKGLSELAERAEEHGWPPAMIKAWQEVGYVVTRANMHTFSAAQVQAYEEAVRRHWAAEDRPDEDMSPDELVAEVADATLKIVAKTLETEAEWPARRVAAGFVRFSGEEGRETARLLVYVLTRRVFACHHENPEATAIAEAQAWVAEHLEPAAATAVQEALGLMECPDAPVWQDPDEDLLAALIWLSTGLAATSGGGDPQWLRRFDGPPPDHCGSG